MAQFGFYFDNGSGAPDFTKPINGTTPLSASIDIDIGGTVDVRIWFGSDQTTQQVQDASSPGVAQVTVSILDSATGNANTTSRVKLASTSGGLTGAVGGAALNLGTAVIGGSGTAAQIWVRYSQTSPGENGGVPITYTDLTLQTNTLRQVAYP